jgi:hypothetical protein
MKKTRRMSERGTMMTTTTTTTTTTNMLKTKTKITQPLQSPSRRSAQLTRSPTRKSHKARRKSRLEIPLEQNGKRIMSL